MTPAVYRCVCGWSGDRAACTLHPRQGFIVCPRCWPHVERIPRRTHNLKTWPEPFAAIVHGHKHHEIRRADRDFQLNDTLHLLVGSGDRSLPRRLVRRSRDVHQCAGNMGTTVRPVRDVDREGDAMTPPPLDLPAIRALCEAATPGNWRADESRVCDGDCGEPFSYRDGSGTYTEHHGGCLTICTAELGDAVSDARFIAAARTLIPQLLAAVEQLQRERDDARAERDELIEAVIGGPQAKLVELTDLTAAERTAEAIAAWLDGDGTSTRSSALAKMIRSGEWKENR